MIEILDSPAHVVAMRISGAMTGNDIDKAAAAVDAALAGNPRISIYGELDDSFSYTLEGLYKDLKYDLGMIGRLDKFYRAAVVTDKRWIAGLARAEGIVFSSVDIRVFAMKDRAAGLEWSSEMPPPAAKPEPPAPAITFIETDSPTVMAYEVDGRITEKDMEAAIKWANEFFDRSEKVGVLGRMTNFKGFDLKAVASEGLFGMKSNAVRKVDKYAVVGPPAWMRNFLELIGPMFSVEIRIFESEKEGEAWEWLGARPANV